MTYTGSCVAHNRRSEFSRRHLHLWPES